jgi:CRISPR-associated protein Cmr2
MENLGADHVLYPSLIDQPLVNAYLKDEWEVSGKFVPGIWAKQQNGIASLPNKFLFLIPFGKAEEIATELEGAISGKWMELSKMTRDSLLESKDLSEDEQKHLDGMFKRQTGNFWEFQWAAAQLADMDDQTEIEKLLDKSQWENQLSYLNTITPILKGRGYNLKNTSRGVLYSTTHSLVQSALAADKARRSISRPEEPGEKCQMCGEFEALHGKPWQGEKATEYANTIKEFWNRFSSDDDFKENEHLCAMCFIKRYAPRVLKKDKHHILKDIFKKADTFPSTTMMALTDYFQRNKIEDSDDRRKIADRLYGSKSDEAKVKGSSKISNTDKYYAILMMDGDNMGKLVNGETIAATWKDIMHPDIAKRLTMKDFDPLYKNVWNKIYESPALNKRLVTPAIHAAISESLGDFSIYGVAPIVAGYGGRLVYAGGDDVCAFMPVNSAFAAAREIQKYYTSVFRFIDLNGDSNVIEDEWAPKPGKLSINLGIGDSISISAAILICHHKESLTQMIEEAHHILKSKAKEKAGRNACVIELRKRHGGSRFFTRKWSDTKSWDAFEKIRKITRDEDRELSQSLLYRLEVMRPGIDAIIRQNANGEGMLSTFIARQIERSKTKSGIGKDEIANAITQIVWDKSDKDKPFKSEGLLVAAFLGGEEEND